MALNVYSRLDDFNRIKNEIQICTNKTDKDFNGVSAIMMLKAVNNVIASNRPFQKNANDIKDFLPVIQRSEYFKNWRYKIKTICNGTEGFTILRPNLQNGYEYVQITFEGSPQDLKRNLKENDRLFLIKREGLNSYELLKIDANNTNFTENEDFVTFNQNKLNEETYFELPIISNFNCLAQPLQKIYFGSPGTGKSTELKRFVKDNNLELIRTTFHPDTDYHSFVGGYKPIMQGDKIIYRFVPQAFTKAYVKAHQNPEIGYVLAIEEINRGNCASIFGDLFQCLDRDKYGYSEYEIEAEADLADYLISEGLSTEIKLPPNLLIYATMNTSDQSLFPMDAAFKRRWEWQYVPIKFNEDSAKTSIVFDDSISYNWQSFVETINPKIEEITKSEDKKIGVYFITPTNGTEISIEQFKNKVMFYLWSEVCKDERDSPENFFQYLDNEGVPQIFSFNDLFEENGNEILKGFMKFLLPK